MRLKDVEPGKLYAYGARRDLNDGHYSALTKVPVLAVGEYREIRAECGWKVVPSVTRSSVVVAAVPVLTYSPNGRVNVWHPRIVQPTKLLMAGEELDEILAEKAKADKHLIDAQNKVKAQKAKHRAVVDKRLASLFGAMPKVARRRRYHNESDTDENVIELVLTESQFVDWLGTRAGEAWTAEHALEYPTC